MRSPFPDDWLPSPAHSRAGVFTTTQAVAEGMSKRQVAYRLKSGLWLRVAGDGIRRCADAQTPEHLAHAAALTWPNAPVCGPSAAALLGAPVPPSTTVHVISGTGRKPRLNLVPHDWLLPPDDVQLWGQVLVTKPVRAYLDALVLVPPDDAQSLFVWLVTRNRLQPDHFAAHLAQWPRRWGNRRLRRFLADTQAGVMSQAEARAQRVLQRAGVSGWTANTTVRDASGIIGRADILFRTERVVVEIDGRSYHGAVQFQQDRSRQNRLIAAGYAVLRFTWQDLTNHPTNMVAQIETLRATRTSPDAAGDSVV